MGRVWEKTHPFAVSLTAAYKKAASIHTFDADTLHLTTGKLHRYFSLDNEEFSIGGEWR